MVQTSTALLTDKYELTMIQAALESGVAHKRAVFEAFNRRLPQGYKYGVVAGIERIRDAVERFVFTSEQIDFLRADGSLNEETLEALSNFKFSGTITAFKEGSVFYPYSPVVTVEGTFLEAVVLETVILSILNYDSAVASAASRMVNVAQGRAVQELGARRAHEDAAVSASRAAFIAGFDGTSNLEAGMQYGIPVFGTSAHAFTLAHHTEKEAFKAQVDALGTGTTLLVDTYDTEQGIRNAVEVAGTGLGAIRIDSGDLREETFKARALLDSLGAVNTRIVVSSDLDEYTINELMDGDSAPIDAFGVGTRVVTGSGNPTMGMVYKLVAIEDEDGSMRPVAKASSGKKSVGGKKKATNIVKGGILTRHHITQWDDEVVAGEGELVSSPQVTIFENGVSVNKSIDPVGDAREEHSLAREALHWTDQTLVAGVEPFVTVIMD